MDNARGTEEPHPQPSPGSGLSWGPSPTSTSGGEEETPGGGCPWRRESAHSPPERRTTAGAGEHGIKAPQERMADCPCLGPCGPSCLCHRPTCNHCDMGPNPV